MTGYTKLFQGILASSIWGEDDKTRIVWITMLALANRDGFVVGSVGGLARQAVVSREDCERALGKFEAPDPDSTTKDHEGRRIKTVDGGWLLLNHAKYRAMMSLEERREYNRVKKQEYRVKERLANKELAAREIIRNKMEADAAVNGQ